jgi:hypothetical protein
LHYDWLLLLLNIIFFSKRHVNARIIAFRAIDIVDKTLAVVFERELLGFRHVGRLEHHAIAPVARLPK